MYVWSRPNACICDAGCSHCYTMHSREDDITVVQGHLKALLFKWSCIECCQWVRAQITSFIVFEQLFHPIIEVLGAIQANLPACMMRMTQTLFWKGIAVQLEVAAHFPNYEKRHLLRHSCQQCWNYVATWCGHGHVGNKLLRGVATLRTKETGQLLYKAL